jgi:hypothetical protein
MKYCPMCTALAAIQDPRIRELAAELGPTEALDRIL